MPPPSEAGRHVDLPPSSDPDELDALLVEARRQGDVLWVTLHGEADISTLHHLEAALARLDLDGLALVHLDLNLLEFADAATLRRLAMFAHRARRDGHTVRTRGTRKIVHEVAGLMGIGEVLGIS